MNTTPSPGSQATSGRPAEADGGEPLGETLRRARAAMRMSLRAVESATDNKVTNGYLSQIEKGAVTRPSPNVLYHLAAVYGLDYGALLVRAGHRLPRDQVGPDARSLEGIPMNALADLTAEERAELTEYVEFLRFRRSSGGAGPTSGGPS